MVASMARGLSTYTGEVPVAGDQSPLLYLPDEVQHLLGAAHGKGGYDQVAPLVQGGLDAPGQGGHIVYALAAVLSVAVGGFYHQVLAVLHILGVFQDGLVQVAQVSAEADFSGLAALVSQTSMAAEPSRCPTSVKRMLTQSFTWIGLP